MSATVARTASPVKPLTGISLFRGIAAFGVIYIHSPLALGKAPVSPIAAYPVPLFEFAVPFFLLTSFYFAARSSRAAASFTTDLSRRAQRLLLPFLFWTAIYLLLKVGKFVVQHRPPGAIFADPIEILVSGSAVHLYFIPLLFVGLLVLRAITPAVRRLSPAPCLLLLVAAICLKDAAQATGNGYHMQTARAFEALCNTRALGILDAPARIALVVGSYALRCLPLTIIALLLARYLDPVIGRIGPGRARPAAFLLFIAAVTLYHNAIYVDEAQGLAAFLLAYTLTGVVPASELVARVGQYSYGIYLVHQVFLEMLQVVLEKSHQVRLFQGPAGPLLISLLTFSMAWGTIALVKERGDKLKTLFGLE